MFLAFKLECHYHPGHFQTNINWDSDGPTTRLPRFQVDFGSNNYIVLN